MTPFFKPTIIVLTLILMALLNACSTGLQVLDGATHACGTVHLEGYLTDTQGEVVVVKAPEGWTAEQVKAFCTQE